MKNENKCFFSISLENGIIISGNTPDEVHNFLHKMHSAFFELTEDYSRHHCEVSANESTEIFWHINDALDTLHNHLNK